MIKDIINNQWINVGLYVFNVSTKDIDFTIKKLSAYAKEVNWDVRTEEKKSIVDVYIYPKTKSVSPVELESLIPKIIDLMNKISVELNIKSSKGDIIIQNVKEDDIQGMKDREMIKLFQDILLLKFKLKYRIILEEKNFELANKVFRSSLYFDFEPPTPFRKFLNKISKTAESKSREKVRKLLYDLCAMNYETPKPLNIK